VAEAEHSEGRLLGVEEFAREAGYSTRHVRRKIHRGEIKAAKPFVRKWVIPESELKRLKEEREASEEARAAARASAMEKKLLKPLPRRTRPEEREQRCKAEEEPLRRKRSSDLKTLEELADI